MKIAKSFREIVRFFLQDGHPQNTGILLSEGVEYLYQSAADSGHTEKREIKCPYKCWTLNEALFLCLAARSFASSLSLSKQERGYFFGSSNHLPSDPTERKLLKLWIL